MGSEAQGEHPYYVVFQATGWLSVVLALACTWVLIQFVYLKLVWSNAVQRGLFYAIAFLVFNSWLAVVACLGAFMPLDYCIMPDMLTWFFPEITNPFSISINVLVGIRRISQITRGGTWLKKSEWNKLACLEKVTYGISIMCSILFGLSGLPWGTDPIDCTWKDWWILLRVCLLVVLDILNTIGSILLIRSLTEIFAVTNSGASRKKAVQPRGSKALRMIKYNAIISCLIYKPHIIFEFYRFWDPHLGNMFWSIFLQISSLSFDNFATCIFTYKMVNCRRKPGAGHRHSGSTGRSTSGSTTSGSSRQRDRHRSNRASLSLKTIVSSTDNAPSNAIAPPSPSAPSSLAPSSNIDLHSIQLDDENDASIYGRLD